MLAAAIAQEPHFEMDDCEIGREGRPSPSIRIHLYREKFPEAKIYYFIGDDNLPELETWKDIDLLRELASIVVLTRARHAFSLKFPHDRAPYRDFLDGNPQSHCPRPVRAVYGASPDLRRDHQAWTLPQ